MNVAFLQGRDGPGQGSAPDANIPSGAAALVVVANRDAILCVDGQETLNFGRQTMPTLRLHR